MKKHLLVVILALVVSTPLMADTIGVYFTQDGETYSRYTQFSNFTYEGYVTVYVEDVVDGILEALEQPGEGRVLVVDHHPGRLIGIRGRVIRAFTGASGQA